MVPGMDKLDKARAAAARKSSPFERLTRAFFSCRSEETRRAYARDILDLAAFLDCASGAEAVRLLLGRPGGAANEAALAYKDHLLSRGLAPATVNRRLAAIRSLSRLGRTLGVTSVNIEIRNVKSRKLRDTRGPGTAAVARMLGVAAGQRDESKAARDCALLRLLFDLGLRRSEVARIALADLDRGSGTIAILGKGEREPLRLALPEKTMAALASWLSFRGPAQGPLFRNFDRAEKGVGLSPSGVYAIVRDLGRRAGVRAHPHGIRHTSITEAVRAAQRAGYGLETARDFSRHADVRTLMIYRDRDECRQGVLASLVAERL